jgi:hypothetical protein
MTEDDLRDEIYDYAPADVAPELHDATREGRDR